MVAVLRTLGVPPRVHGPAPAGRSWSGAWPRWRSRHGGSGWRGC